MLPYMNYNRVRERMGKEKKIPSLKEVSYENQILTLKILHLMRIINVI